MTLPLNKGRELGLLNKFNKSFVGFRKMIQLQVHLQLPCYDFCFLYWRNIGELSGEW